MRTTSAVQNALSISLSTDGTAVGNWRSIGVVSWKRTNRAPKRPNGNLTQNVLVWPLNVVFGRFEHRLLGSPPAPPCRHIRVNRLVAVVDLDARKRLHEEGGVEAGMAKREEGLMEM